MGDDEDNLTSPKEEIEQISAHRKVWNQKQLLSNILSRYFQIEGELGGTKWPVWKVDEKDDLDVHQSLEDLNHHLSNLGWMAKLQLGDTWLVQIIPYPERQFPSSKTTLSFWSLSILTATLAGMVWLEGSRPDGGWFVESLFLDSFIGYTIPIFTIIIIASFAQKYHAQKNDLRIGHLTPIPEPAIGLFSLGLLSKSMLIWPFGVLIIPSLPRMDARPWKDRSSLGWSALIVPSTLIVSGFFLWIIGLILTPDFVEVTSMQYVSEMPLLVNLLSPLISDGITTKLIWSHPFSKAGSMLCFFGWVSLLPIPTFPGGRLLIARSGMGEARNSTNQLFLFAVILAFAWMFNAFGSFNIWLPVLGIIFPLLLLMGSDRRIPVILNEPKGIDSENLKRMGVFLFAIFLLGLPSQIPFEMDEDWDDDITYDFSNSITVYQTNDSWIGHLTVEIINPSSITHDWKLDLARVDGQVSPNWDFTWNCSDDEQTSIIGMGCGDEILPGMKTSVELEVSWPESSFSPFSEQIYLITYVMDEPFSDEIMITPDIEVYPDSNWYLNYDSDEVMRCIKIYSNKESNFNVTFPNSQGDFDFQTRMYWIAGHLGLEAQLEFSTEELCVRGQDPVILLRSYVLNILNIENHSFYPNSPQMESKLISPTNGTLITSEDIRGWGSEFNSGDILTVKGETCQLEPKVSTPTKPDNQSQQWIWDTNYRGTALIPAIQENDSILLVVEEDITICSENLYPRPNRIINVDLGPELVLHRNGISHRLWTSVWASAANGQLSGANLSEFTLYNPENVSVSVNIVQTTSGNLSDEWVINTSTTELVMGENEFKFTPPSSIVSTMWLDFEDGEIYIYLGSYS